jgi:hypothetical protein
MSDVDSAPHRCGSAGGWLAMTHKADVLRLLAAHAM